MIVKRPEGGNSGTITREPGRPCPGPDASRRGKPHPVRRFAEAEGLHPRQVPEVRHAAADQAQKICQRFRTLPGGVGHHRQAEQVHAREDARGPLRHGGLGGAQPGGMAPGDQQHLGLPRGCGRRPVASCAHAVGYESGQRGGAGSPMARGEPESRGSAVVGDQSERAPRDGCLFRWNDRLCGVPLPLGPPLLSRIRRCARHARHARRSLKADPPALQGVALCCPHHGCPPPESHERLCSRSRGTAPAPRKRRSTYSWDRPSAGRRSRQPAATTPRHPHHPGPDAHDRGRHLASPRDDRTVLVGGPRAGGACPKRTPTVAARRSAARRKGRATSSPIWEGHIINCSGNDLRW